MDWYTFLIILHIVGTALGVGGATFAEVNIIRALRDGVVSIEESELMRGTYMVLRFGLFLLVFSGFGFLLFYRLNGTTEMLYSPMLWAKLTIIGVLVLNVMLLHSRKISLLLGSAISITSWYTALILGVLFRGVQYSYVSVLIVFIISVAIMYFVINFVHQKFTLHKQ
ncbi:MAG: hypothetical protein AAB513_03725 [Patescibacteria group bacterium]